MPLFGPLHIALVLATATAAGVWSALIRHRRVPVRAVCLVLGYGLGANEIAWWIFRYSLEGLHLTNLPLQLSDAAVWLAVFACLTLRPWLVEFTYFAGLSSAATAVLMPDLWSPWPSYPAIYFFAAHGGVVVAAAVLIFGRVMWLRPGAMRRSYMALLLYAAIIGTVDWLTGANYMYLRAKPKTESLLNVFGPWPVYLAPAALAAFLVFWFLALIAPKHHGAEGF